MRHAERWEDAEDPAEGVSPHHCLGNVLQDEDNDDEEAATDEVQEERHDLRIDVRLEEERSHVSEGHDCNWVE